MPQRKKRQKVPPRRGRRAPLAPFKRQVHIGDATWSYAISREGLRIRSPEGITSFVRLGDLLFHGGDPEDNSPPAIGPSLVKAYIRVVLLEGRRWDCDRDVEVSLVNGYLLHRDAAHPLPKPRFHNRLHRALAAEPTPAWYTPAEIHDKFLAPDSYRDALDLIVNLYSDGLLETDRNLSERDCRFRLRSEPVTT